MRILQFALEKNLTLCANCCYTVNSFQIFDETWKKIVLLLLLPSIIHSFIQIYFIA